MPVAALLCTPRLAEAAGGEAWPACARRHFLAVLLAVVPRFICLSVVLSQSRPSYKPSPRVAIAPCSTAGNAAAHIGTQRWHGGCREGFSWRACLQQCLCYTCPLQSQHPQRRQAGASTHLHVPLAALHLRQPQRLACVCRRQRVAQVLQARRQGTRQAQ